MTEGGFDQNNDEDWMTENDWIKNWLIDND